MPVIYEERGGTSYVLVLKRTPRAVVYIGVQRKYRRILDATPQVFDRAYRIAPHDYVKAASTWLKSTLKTHHRVKEVLEMLISVKANKVVAKNEDGTTVEAAKGVKMFDGPEALAPLRMSGIVKLYNANVGEGSQVATFETIDEATAKTWAVLCNVDIPAPTIKEKPAKAEKAAKEPKGPKQYVIAAKDEAHEYKEGTKMRAMVDALVGGATFADLAVLIDTKVVNVQHRVLRLMPNDGYGIRNEGAVFFITIPPYKADASAEKKAAAEAKKAEKEAEKTAKAEAKAAEKAEKDAAKAAEKAAKDEAKAAEKQAKADAKAAEKAAAE